MTFQFHVTGLHFTCEDNGNIVNSPSLQELLLLDHGNIPQIRGVLVAQNFRIWFWCTAHGHDVTVHLYIHNLILKLKHCVLYIWLKSSVVFHV